MTNLLISVFIGHRKKNLNFYQNLLKIFSLSQFFASWELWYWQYLFVYGSLSCWKIPLKFNPDSTI